MSLDMTMVLLRKCLLSINMMFDNKMFEDAHIELGVFMAIEEYFGIEIKDEEVLEIDLPLELIDLIKDKKNNNSEPHRNV